MFTISKGLPASAVQQAILRQIEAQERTEMGQIAEAFYRRGRKHPTFTSEYEYEHRNTIARGRAYSNTADAWGGCFARLIDGYDPVEVEAGREHRSRLGREFRKAVRRGRKL